jgi:iron complex outermembrane receptor protein
VGAACAQSGSVNYTNWSYTAGLDWQVVDRTLVYVKTSRGFKSGGLNAFASAYAPITGYAPEVDTDYEVGVKSELLDRRLRLDLDYYHTNYSNIQRTVATSTQVGIVTEVQNAATAKIDGVEAEARFIPAVGLTLSANGTYTNARYINYEVLNPTYPSGFQNHSGLPFQGVAKYTYTLGAGYDYPIGENNLHAEVNWSHRSSAALFENDSLPSTYGGTDFEPLSAVTQKAYGLLDASLSVEIPKYRTTLTIWGKNVLNKRYLVSIIGLVNNGVGIKF